MNGKNLEILDDANLILKENINLIEILENYYKNNYEARSEELLSFIKIISKKQKEVQEKFRKFTFELYKELCTK